MRRLRLAIIMAVALSFVVAAVCSSGVRRVHRHQRRMSRRQKPTSLRHPKMKPRFTAL
jgi:hypothetical protein